MADTKKPQASKPTSGKKDGGKSTTKNGKSSTSRSKACGAASLRKGAPHGVVAGPLRIARAFPEYNTGRLLKVSAYVGTTELPGPEQTQSTQ